MKTVCAMSLSLLLLLAVGTEGMVTSRRNRCKCLRMFSGNILVENVAKFEVFPATSSCGKVEYIVTRKHSGRQECLDPTLPKVQRLRKRYLAYKKTHERRPIRSQ